MTYDHDFQSHVSCDHSFIHIHILVMTHIHAKGQGQRHSVQKSEWKQIDGQTDGRMDGADYVTGTFLTITVSNNLAKN